VVIAGAGGRLQVGARTATPASGAAATKMERNSDNSIDYLTHLAMLRGPDNHNCTQRRCVACYGTQERSVLGYLKTKTIKARENE
jgi:hypothetical protein